MLSPRQRFSRGLKIAVMREIESGKGKAKVARMFQSVPNGRGCGTASLSQMYRMSTNR
jgi:hypothetical protein